MEAAADMMKNRFLSVAGALLLSCLSAVPAHADIVIGVAGPMSGEFAVFGEQMAAGAGLAVEDINAHGGLLGENVRLEIGDDECETEPAVAVANQMVGRDIRFMAGHMCFGPSIAGSDVYAKAGIVQISPGTTLPRYTDGRPGPGVFRLAPSDDAQGAAAAGYLADLFGGQRIALVHDRSAYGKSLVDEVKAELNARGVREVLYQGVDIGADDYDGLVSTFQLQGVNALFFGGYHPEAAKIVRGIRERGMSVRVMGGDALATDEFWLLAGEDGEGTLFTLPPDPRTEETAQPVLERLIEAEVATGPLAIRTYAAVEAWAQAAARAGSTELDDVSRTLSEETFGTVLGSVSFDGSGDDSLPDFVLQQWRGGRYGRF